MLTWTDKLAAAARAIRDEPEPHPYWPESDADVRSRAREFAQLAPGTTFEPYQLEYLACFTQRLDYTLGGSHKPRASHAAFKLALDEASA